jgi:arylsulfatase B
MNRRDFLMTAGLGAMALARPRALRGAEGVSGRRPNVVIVLTDDQGYGDLACHGNPVIQTPNLDRLHAESVRLTDFHVNPFCSPTRAALMTGRFSDRTHVRCTVYARNHLNRDETTAAEFFKASGYRTGHFGKWHLGRNYPYRPMDRGFDQWVGHGDGGIGTSSDYWGNDKMNDTYWRNGRWEKFSGFCTDVFFDEAMKFIGSGGPEPFFVYLATNVPHAPWHVLEEWRKPYEGKVPTDLPAGRQAGVADFYATLSRMDWNLGRLRRFLADRGLADDTILLFLTDNGTSGGDEVFNAGMRGKKGSVYEGGHRVPCFVHWRAGGLDKPADVAGLTSHIDLLPTLIDLCGLKPPARGHLDFDGRSLAPLLRNPQAGWADRTIFLHSQNVQETPVKWQDSLVATQQWRLIDGKELYDIRTDPGQKRSIDAERPDVVALLRARYEKHWDALRMADFPYPRPIVGSGHDDETWLTCDAWIRDRPGPATWDQSHVRAGANNSGFWPIEAAAAGTYRFQVRRWPKEVNRPITAALPPAQAGDIYERGRLVQPGPGKAIPAVKVVLQVGETTVERPITEADTNASFDLPLAAGPTRVQAWLVDDKGAKRGAYYVYVTKTPTPANTRDG